MRLSALIIVALLGGPSVGSAQAPHPFSVHDMLAMDRISDPQVSPDGTTVAFTVRVTDVAANKGRTDVWVAAVDGSRARRLTAHEANDSGARWMPDGKSLVFLSTRGGSSQVWQIPLDGGEARALTHLAVDVNNLEVFPDGKRLLLTLEIYPDTAPGRRDRGDGEARCREGEEQGQREDLRVAALPPLGHVGGRQAQPRIRLGRRLGDACRSDARVRR